MDIVLVHGSYHGAWCWDLLRPELERRGHRTIAADLPVSERGAGTAAYADAVEAAMGDLDAPVIVAHSMGGLVAPVVAVRRPVSLMVFLAAFLAKPGASANDQRAAEAIDPPIAPSTTEWVDLGDDLWQVGPATATEIFYHDAAPDLAAWATARLRPQWYGVMAEVTPLAAWPGAPSRVIACGDDHAINADWVRRAARERLGVEAVEMPGGHSPFLTRPAELAGVIDGLLGPPA